ncbi:MAG TPA: D-2-hydroxyacid dehydrogenase [Geopsychrobacteraceae bacterium]|nr:D-2-hydroxyacid dehydrogenase [Geopsychrobacteraceae bacterium]
MKIVVLDGFTLNPGDLSWDELQQLAPCEIHDRTTPDQLPERASGAEILLTNKTVINAETIANLPELRYIGVLATGYNVIDVEAAKARGIVVTNIPGYSTASVTQMVFALLLELTQQVGHHNRQVHQGRWVASPDFSFCDRPLTELAGKTFGVVGCGQIGRQVAQVARAFGMDVMAQTANPDKHRSWASDQQVELVHLNTLFSNSDVISLHCPLTPETEKMVDENRLARMKKGALLINTGRGPLLDEAAVAAALNSGRLGGFGADVLSSEPPAANNPLLGAPNSFITPHIAWATREARERLYTIATDNIKAFLDGEPKNLVS